LARILILDGHSAAALAFTRSAGRAGHWVAVGANIGQFAAAKLSRFCNLAFDYPVSTDDAGTFVEAIADFVRQNGIDLVIPVTDWTLQPISEFRDSFNGVCRVVLPPRDAVDAASDKYKTIELARKLGIVVPATWLIRDAADLRTIPALEFPLVVKDRMSVRRIGNRTVFGSVTYAFGKEELERKANERLQVAGDVLIQKFVTGEGIGFSCLVTRAAVALPFAWRRIREVDPRGSASSCREAIELDEPLASASTRLVQTIGFEGIAMVEYKRSANGEYVLMEINGRPWGSIALPIASGFDYPRYLIDWCLNGDLPVNSLHYRRGTVCRRMVSELGHLSNVRRGRPANWPGSYPSFWSSLAKIAVPWYPGMHYDDLWLSDLRPWIAETGNWFRRRLK
jgi:predicted ATP-grasp superfamily ATP-dependent carboligase